MNLASIFACGICDAAVDLPLAHIRFLDFMKASEDNEGKKAQAVAGVSPGAGATQFAPRLKLFLRELFVRLLILTDTATEIETRVMSLRQYADLKQGILWFLRDTVVPAVKKEVKKQIY